jgi:hypothetical protein
MNTGIYDLDVALATIGIVKGKKIVEYSNETDADRQQVLKQEIDMLKAEEKTLYSDDIMQRSVMDKVFRLYSPMVKSRTNGKIASRADF